MILKAMFSSELLFIFKDALASFESKTTRVAARFIPFDWLNEKFENNNEIKIISFVLHSSLSNGMAISIAMPNVIYA